jgi:hypothetical protein
MEVNASAAAELAIGPACNPRSPMSAASPTRSRARLDGLLLAPPSKTLATSPTVRAIRLSGYKHVRRFKPTENIISRHFGIYIERFDELFWQVNTPRRGRAEPLNTAANCSSPTPLIQKDAR